MSVPPTIKQKEEFTNAHLLVCVGILLILGSLCIIGFRGTQTIHRNNEVLQELPQVYLAARNLGPATDARTMATVVNAQRPYLGVRTLLPGSRQMQTNVPYIVSTMPEGFTVMEKSESGAVFQLASNRRQETYQISQVPNGPDIPG